MDTTIIFLFFPPRQIRVPISFFVLVATQQNTRASHLHATVLAGVQIVSHFSASFGIFRAHHLTTGSLENKVPHLQLSVEIEHFLSALQATDIQTCPVPSKSMNPVLFLCSQSTKIQDIQWCLNISNGSSFTCHKTLKQDLPNKFSSNHTGE